MSSSDSQEISQEVEERPDYAQYIVSVVLVLVCGLSAATPRWIPLGHGCFRWS